MTTNEMSLGEFVKQLIVRMHDNHLKMLFKEDRPWHLLFYKLSKEKFVGKPEFFDNLHFDWDGPYPKCPELSRFIHALHWTGAVAAINPSYERIMLLSEQMRQLWSQQGESLPSQANEFLEHAAILAGKQFPSEVQSASS
jgi:hypothetical protein